MPSERLSCLDALSFFVDFGTLCVTVAATVVGYFGIRYAKAQLDQHGATNKALFWLELRRMFDEHRLVHQLLRPEGDWKTGGPKTNKEWAAVDAYMGLFEHCERMIQLGVIDEETFMDIYSYRVKNIMNSRSIVVAKLESDERANWQTFSALVHRIERFSRLHQPL